MLLTSFVRLIPLILDFILTKPFGFHSVSIQSSFDLYSVFIRSPLSLQFPLAPLKTHIDVHLFQLFQFQAVHLSIESLLNAVERCRQGVAYNLHFVMNCLSGCQFFTINSSERWRERVVCAPLIDNRTPKQAKAPLNHLKLNPIFDCVR